MNFPSMANRRTLAVPNKLDVCASPQKTEATAWGKYVTRKMDNTWDDVLLQKQQKLSHFRKYIAEESRVGGTIFFPLSA